ncbi:heterokaryon incompatibility protein-domain-containing protein [Rostrohypoxylon terebratum]|nr:heterokaryon incompatibility protein-domain-containing protein [Rostrohypoxylon terebratum]
MAGICNCRRPVIQNVVENLWMCTECGTEIPDDEELEGFQTQNDNNQQTTKTSSLNLSWPKSVNYIDDAPMAEAVIKELEKRECLDVLGSNESEPPFRQSQRKAGRKVTKETITRKYYHYKPLHRTNSKSTKVSQSTIRILRLSHGKPGDPLHSVLIPIALTSYPNYEAVSYTWADEMGDNNCEAALRRFRKINQDTFLWVDSVCINQNDLNERRQQVKLMPAIYSSAIRVLVYLGAGSQNTSNAMFVLSLNGKLAKQYLLDRRYIEALRVLFHLPYFYRIWIIQELALAREVRLYHGYDRQSVCLFQARDKVQEIFKTAAPGDVVPLWLQNYQKSLSAPEDLGNLIFDGMFINASLPQDKIFGFFGMIWSADTEGLIADYSLTVEQVYTGIATYLASRGQLLEILERSNCGILTDKQCEDCHRLNLPSWVPDFRGTYSSSNYSLSFDPDYHPLRFHHSPPKAKLPPSFVGVIQKTGSLVLHGHLLNVNSMQFREGYLYQAIRPSGIRVYIELGRPFIKQTDTIFLFRSENDTAFPLHLRRKKSTRNYSDLYTFAGLCEISIKSIRPKRTNLIVDLFSINRPLFMAFSSFDKELFNHFWDIFMSLNKTRIQKLFDPQPSLYTQLLGDPWENYQRLATNTSATWAVDENLFLVFVSRTYSSSQFARLYDFWMSTRNRKIIKFLETIIEQNRGDTVASYSARWCKWLRNYEMVNSFIKTFIEETIRSQKLDYGIMHQLREQIEQWKDSMLDLTRGLDWPKDYRHPLVELHNEDGSLFLDSLDPRRIEGLFLDITQNLGKRVKAISLKHLNEQPYVHDTSWNDYHVEWTTSLIGRWLHFIELHSWIFEENEDEIAAKSAIGLIYPSTQYLSRLVANGDGVSPLVKAISEEVVII